MSRHIRRFLLALVVCALFAATTGVASSQPAPRAQPAELGDHNGAPPDFVCEDRLEKIILPNGRTLCTHGPDPDEAFASESVELAARAEAPWPCYTTGPAYHSLYLRTATQASRLPSLRTFFESSMRHVQGEFELSATDNGGPGKRLRVLTDVGCNLVIDEVVVTGSAMSDFSTMISELQNKGYNKADRKYLIWADASTYCGIGTFMSDDRKVSYNRNNSSISYARVDTRCWDSAEAHEIAHNLGAVQNSAPRSSGAGHCYDEYDHLCYRDGGSYFANGGSLVVNCPETHRNLMLDCRHDDYYDATGRSPYLSTHWNVATDSRYLVNATDTTTPPPTTTTTSTSATSTSTTVPPTTAAGNHLDADSATLEGSTGKWGGWYSATATRSAEQARSGVASLKVAPTGATWGVTVNNWPGFPATAGNKTIAFSAQSSYAFTASLLVRWKNSSGTDITTDRLSPELNSTWQTATATATAPSGTVSVYVELTGDKAPAGASVYFDDFYVGDSATATTTTTSTTTTAPPSTTTSSTSTSSTSTSTSTTAPPPTTTTTPPTTTTTSSTTSTSTSTTSPSTTSTTSVTGANPQAIVYSTSSNRALPAPLSNATVRSSIYAFVTNSGDISKVEFWLDNPAMTGSPLKSETLAPYDFAGGLISYAYAWNTTGVADGLHTITARVTFKDATTKTTAATFTVDN